MAIVTAGAPGSGKTTLLNQYKKELTESYAYICPDDICLKNQTETYQADIQKSPTKSRATRQSAYDKWRPASNGATHLILAHLLLNSYAFCYGSTSSSSITTHLFEFLKKREYQIKLIHVSAPDSVLWNSIQKRDEEFIQTTHKDIIEKGHLVPQRIYDTFLKYADTIEFYYREAPYENAKLSATWIRQETSDHSCIGNLEIIDPPSYQEIKTLHNDIIKKIDRPELAWELTVEKFSKKI